jgi:hypothetical protein
VQEEETTVISTPKVEDVEVPAHLETVGDVGMRQA